MTKPDGMKRFPIMRQSRYEKPHPIAIPWSVAEAAYSIYRNRHGDEQSLERLGERGGFAPGEMDDMLPDWRERCAVVDREVAAIRSDYDRLAEEVVEMRRFILFNAPCSCEVARNGKLLKRCERCQLVTGQAQALTKGDCDE